MKKYVPEKGDFITLNFDPKSGHEQRGRRPALVVSNTLFNKKTELAIVCPITNTDQGYPFHVAVTNDPDVRGFVMVEQVKSVDFHARKAELIGRASDDVFDMVLSILDPCIY